MGLPKTLYTNVAHQYSRLREKLLHLTYDALGVHFTGTIKVCDESVQSKVKAHAVMKKTYT